MLRERRRHANYKPNRRLDRKSSRGMIYENEELRLRTININAEVERGQSDIRKLRRENEQLKREIWSLRDEYDRINKKMCANKNCSSCEHISNSGSQSEESDYCDTCKEDDALDCCSSGDNCNQQNRAEKPLCSTHSEKSAAADFSFNLKNYSDNTEVYDNYENAQKTLAQPKVAPTAVTSTSVISNPSFLSTTATSTNKRNSKIPAPMDSGNKLRDNFHANFGQLSVLSEENLTNSDGTPSLNGEHGSVKPPISPLRDVQSILPALSHFENIPYEDITTHSKSAMNVCPAEMTDLKRNFYETGMVSKLDHHQKNNVSALNDEDLKSAEDSSEIKQEMTQPRSPKHFFSPINPRRTQQFSNPPDLFVANALASPCYHEEFASKPITTTTPPQMATLVAVPHNSNCSFYDGNLEDLLLEIETLQIQLEKHKSFSQEKLPTSETFSTRKPFRSEMNLVVSCNGCEPRITPIVNPNKSGTFTNNSLVLETPPPSIPQPMILFPQNLTYMTRETIDHGSALGTNSEIQKNPFLFASALPGCVTHQNGTLPPNVALLAFDGDARNVYGEAAVSTSDASDLVSPKPSAAVEKVFETLSSKTPSVDTVKSPALVQNTPSTYVDKGKSSHTAPILSDDQRSSSCASNGIQNDTATSSEQSKKKTSRRISISFSDLKKLDKNENEKEVLGDQSTQNSILNHKVSDASSENSALNDFQKNHKLPQDLITQSTPNSPHFSGRSSAGGTRSHHHHHSVRHCTRKLSQDSSKIARKCSRRFSEGTVDAVHHGSFGTTYGGSCGDNRRHVASQEPTTSVSERNSNSFASSRESSTSQSTHSQRRKLSISSHNGGKIPWCGCWGNGCL